MKRILRAFRHSLDGLAAVYKSEAAFRQETGLAAALLPLACYLAPDRAALALMTGSVVLVLVVELLNSAIEAAIDRFGGEVHPLSRKAKDAGSAAVLVALVMAAAAWACVLL